MMDLKIDSTVILQSIQQIERLKNDQILRELSLNAIALITNRIQNKGQNASNQFITPKRSSGRRDGAYSEKWADARRAKGRQTSIIDLTFTGDMLRPVTGFWFVKVSNSEYVVGFMSQEQANKAASNEFLFGDLFTLSPSELKINLQVLNRLVSENLKR